MYVLGIICICTVLVPLAASHDTRRDIYLSQSCRPLCKDGFTCITFRDINGFPKQECIRLDPHTYRLAGTQIIPLPPSNTGVLQIFDTTHNEQQIPSPSLLDSIRTKESLLNRMATMSQTVRHELLKRLQSIPDRVPINQKPTTAKPIKKLPKVHPTRAPLAEMVVEVASQGRRGFRLPTLKDILNGGKVSTNATAKTTVKHTKQEPRSDMITEKNIQTAKSQSSPKVSDSEKGSTCIKCDPDHGCPSGEYCYFSAECAHRICQPL